MKMRAICSFPQESSTKQPFLFPPFRLKAGLERTIIGNKVDWHKQYLCTHVCVVGQPCQELEPSNE
jgi:hypothetical protein